jgi:hypothetical protein
MLYVAAAISLYQGVFNLLPRASGSGYSTDGSHILAGLFHLDIERHLDRQMRLYNETVSGHRPRDWDSALVQSLKVEALWARSDAEVHLLLFQRHFDCGDFDAARQALRRAKERGRLSPYTRLEDAFFAGFHERAPVQARAALNGVSTAYLRRLPVYWRTAAAVAMSEGDFAQAREALGKAHKLYAAWLLTTEADLDVMAALENRMREAGAPFLLSSATLKARNP